MIIIIGIGLIGGSLALDLKKLYPSQKIVGIDSNTDNLDKAINLHLIDEKGSFNDVKNASMVFICIPVDAILNVLPSVLDQVSKDCLVVDFGSTKFAICEAAKTHKNRKNYLACHPIAGTEFSGPEAAIIGLYEGKTNIICQVEKTAFTIQEQAIDLFKQLGMRLRYMDAKAHDTHIAYVSHLSHISAFMLGKTVIDKEKDEQDIFDLAGSGFASTVRLAKSSPDMWLPIFKQNKTDVLEALSNYIDCLSNFKNLLATDQDEDLYQEMKNTNRIKQIIP